MTIACSLWNHDKIYMCRKSMELCYRLVPLMGDDISYLAQNVIQYIRQVRFVISVNDLERMRSSEYTEFFYNDSSSITFDRGTIKTLIQIILLLIRKADPTVFQVMDELKDLYCTNISSHSEFKELLFDLCCVNDDDTIQLLDTILMLYQQPSSIECSSFLKSIDINPHNLFLYFVYRCGSTHDILIDLLLENDSEFLAYFHQYIRYAINDIKHFKSSLNSTWIDLDTMQTIIANMVLILEGDGFPYNTKPLIRRLTRFEELLAL
ncbi:MAG: hypothetical protein EXX96DRAFT_594560 [Benjaminiella poitrasii]|nr:MAG: hypothetical protein EXX96DRAFT_594560 [Benjaminiella poitrasii]